MLKRLSKLNLDKIAEQNIKIYFTNATILKANELKEKEKKEYLKEIKSRKMYKNIQPRNLKQLIKRMILKLNVGLYLKIR